uniref:Uncharacterized protein n=1 Tax=Proboscia inermis TaxID=420281 RepID=A0A6T8H6Q2_9STRA
MMSETIRTTSTTNIRMLPTTESIEALTSAITDAPSSSGILLSKIESVDDIKEVAKAGIIILTFGGGLIPAAIAANKALLNTFAGGQSKPKDLEEGVDSSTSLDPYERQGKIGEYIESSGASGPLLPGSQFIFGKSADIPLADVVAVVGRIKDVNSIADWENLPSTKLEGVSETNPPMWLPRATFKANVRKAKFQQWPQDAKTGEPVGGVELEQSEGARIKKNGALISDAALDAVYDTWAWVS